MGGMQSCDLFIVVNHAEKLQQGLFYYNAPHHALDLIEIGNFRRKMVQICINQEWVQDAGIIIILSSNLTRTFWKYRSRSYRFTHVDAGCVLQNLSLVAHGLQLGSCPIAGYDEYALKELLRFYDQYDVPQLIIPIGKM